MNDTPMPAEIDRTFDTNFPMGRIEIYPSRNPNGRHEVRIRLPSVLTPQVRKILRTTAEMPVGISPAELLQSNTEQILMRLRMTEDEVNIAKSVIVRLLDELEKAEAATWEAQPSASLYGEPIPSQPLPES